MSKTRSAVSWSVHCFHRITEWPGLEGTFKYHLEQPLCHGQGRLPLDQVAQSPIQPGLEHFHGAGFRSFSGQPVPDCQSVRSLSMWSITARHFFVYFVWVLFAAALSRVEGIFQVHVKSLQCMKMTAPSKAYGKIPVIQNADWERSMLVAITEK